MDNSKLVNDLVDGYTTRQINFVYNQMFWSGNSDDDYIHLGDTDGIDDRKRSIMRVLKLADDSFLASDYEFVKAMTRG